MPISIMLDSGHGGSDPGAVYMGRQEKDDTLELVLRLGEILQSRGFDIEYTRTTDIYESPFQKAMEANMAGADYFLSIHRNSFPTANTASGVESLVYDKSGIKLELAENIDKQLAAIGFQDLGVKARPNLVVLKRTQMPAVLVEVGFINSDADNQRFDDQFEEIAVAIADGVSNTLGNPSSNRGNRLETSVNGNHMDSMGDAFTQPPSTSTMPLPPENNFEIQVGSFRNELYANRLLRELVRQDYPARIVDSDGYFRVRVGNFHNLDDAVKLEQRLRRAGYQTWVVVAT